MTPNRIMGWVFIVGSLCLAAAFTLHESKQNKAVVANAVAAKMVGHTNIVIGTYFTNDLVGLIYGTNMAAVLESIRGEMIGWPDITTNQYWIKQRDLMEYENGLVRGETDDPGIPIGSVWASVSYCASESANVPHCIAIFKVMAVHGKWVETIATVAFPSCSQTGTGAYYYFDYKPSFLKGSQRLEPDYFE